MKIVLFIIILVLLTFGQGDLKGFWISKGYDYTVTLEFQSDRLIYDGETMLYQLVDPNIIRVQEDGSFTNYSYVLQNGRLTIIYPDGNYEIFTRSSSQKMTTPKESTPKGNVALLRGWLCYWSGSSSSYSSYSSTSKVYFDGRGNFAVSGEASFSGDAGSAYSGGGVDERGTYSIQGNKVILKFQDGSTGSATINMQQYDGSITELMYNGYLYATKLCN